MPKHHKQTFGAHQLVTLDSAIVPTHAWTRFDSQGLAVALSPPWRSSNYLIHPWGTDSSAGAR